MASDFSIEGLSELHKTLQELPAKIEGNVMRGALRAGQKVLLDAARANVPVKDGDLRDSIRISFKSRSQKYGWVRMHLVAGNAKAFYAHMVEFGTAQHLIAVTEKVQRKTRRGTRDVSIKKMNQMLKSGALRIGDRYVGPSVLHPGAASKPFMRPAFDSANTQALTAVRDYIATRLPKEVAKQGR